MEITAPAITVDEPPRSGRRAASFINRGVERGPEPDRPARGPLWWFCRATVRRWSNVGWIRFRDVRRFFGHRRFRPLYAALGAPAVATFVNEAVPRGDEASVAVYMLGVIGAALVGGLIAGMVAAVMSAVLEFYFFISPAHSFSLDRFEDLVPLVTFVGAAAVVAGLVGRVERARREAFDLAERLQATLLPPTLPVVPGLDIGARFEPGTERLDIGGDFYDVFPAGNGGWLVALGDVQGKGVEAAAVTALARHTLRALVGDPGWSPESILRRLNELLIRIGSPCVDGAATNRLASDWTDTRFVTVAVLAVWPESSAFGLRICCAGHSPPLLVRAGAERLGTIGSAGTALGIIENPDLPDICTVLQPGDVVVAFTDGLTEQRQGGEFFEDLRLEEVVLEGIRAADTAQGLADRLLAESRSFAPEAAPDDVAVLVLRVT